MKKCWGQHTLKHFICAHSDCAGITVGPAQLRWRGRAQYAGIVAVYNDAVMMLPCVQRSDGMVLMVVSTNVLICQLLIRKPVQNLNIGETSQMLHMLTCFGVLLCFCKSGYCWLDIFSILCIEVKLMLGILLESIYIYISVFFDKLHTLFFPLRLQ